MHTGQAKRSRIWGTLDAFVEGGPVLGRRVANSTFLSALLRADPYDAYHFFLPDQSTAETLKGWLEDNFSGLMRRGAFELGFSAHMRKALAERAYHCMHLSDPLTACARLAQVRNAVAANLFPITGLTHSLSYERFMPEYLRHLWPGVSPRDAIIVSSESARAFMSRVFEGLLREYGLDRARFLAPRLELIPLGVDFSALPAPDERWEAPPGARNAPARELRQSLGLGDEPLFLCLSRICPYSKMDLLPLFSAFRLARERGLGQDCRLLIAGWADEDDDLPEALRGYASALGIKTELRPRPSDSERKILYAAADVFLSPSDNIQETFGLTVAEAGGACLPVIASDFDGYRDIVAHEESGLLIPTLGFAASAESELQALFWADKQYHLKLAQQTALSVPDLAAALARLGADPALRRRMGLAARKRVAARFSFEIVINSCVRLWDGLAAIPIKPEREAALRAAEHPLRMRFAEYFRGHFSAVLDAETMNSLSLKRSLAGEAMYRAGLPVLPYAGMEFMLDPEAVRRMLLAARKSVPAISLFQDLRTFFANDFPPALAEERARFTILWGLKHNYLESTP